MTRALVLGGGGPVGIGWEAGVLVGLANGGVDVSRADAMIGTSAGSVVGFTLANGGDLSEAPRLVGVANEVAPGDAAIAGADQELQLLMAALAEAAVAPSPEAAAHVRRKLGKIAVDARTIPEDTWLEMFATFAGEDWPDGFTCTAVDVEDGRFVLWEAGSGVDVQRAIASSCAVPAVFPPVTINGKRYMDGGVRDVLNADAAEGHDIVLALSCTMLEIPEGFGEVLGEGMEAYEAVLKATRDQLDGLAAGGAKVEVILPGQEMLEISGWGMHLMDFSRAAAAYEAGVHQGEAEAECVGGTWVG